MARSEGAWGPERGGQGGAKGQAEEEIVPRGHLARFPPAKASPPLPTPSWASGRGSNASFHSPRGSPSTTPWPPVPLPPQRGPPGSSPPPPGSGRGRWTRARTGWISGRPGPRARDEDDEEGETKTELLVTGPKRGEQKWDNQGWAVASAARVAPASPTPPRHKAPPSRPELELTNRARWAGKAGRDGKGAGFSQVSRGFSRREWLEF